MSDSKKRFELPSIQNLVDGVKQMINPEAETPNPKEGDDLGHQLQDLSLRAQGLRQYQADFSAAMSKQLEELNALVNSIYSNVEELRGDAADEDSGGEDSAKK